MAGGDLNYLLSLANSCFRSQMFGNVQPTVAYPFENVLITSCFWTGRLSSILDIKCAVHSIQSLVCTAFHLREWMCVGLSCFESQTSLFASRGCWKPALPIWNICTVTTLYWDNSINLSLIGCVLILPRHSLDQLFFNFQPAVPSQNARWTSQLCGLETFKALDSGLPLPDKCTNKDLFGKGYFKWSLEVINGQIAQESVRKIKHMWWHTVKISHPVVLFLAQQREIIPNHLG